MMFTDDPERDFLEYDFEHSEWLNSRIRCDVCNEPIQEDFFYEINDDIVCDCCILEYIGRFKRDYERCF